MPDLAILDNKGKKSSTVELPKEQFGVHVNDAVIHQAIVMYQANNRQGTLSTKGRAEVSGGGKKPWKQKGTGRARAGSSRSPLWKKGGIIFGPKPREFSFDVPKKVKTAALREALNAKFLDNTLVCVDDASISTTGKTKDFAGVLTALNLKGRTLAILEGADEKTLLASRNISWLTLERAMDVNALHILSHKNVLVTKTAISKLLKRIQA